MSKKSKLSEAYKKQLEYIANKSGIKTMNIEGTLITAEQVKTAMTRNIFIGTHVVAYTKDGSTFVENVARSLYLYDDQPSLVLPKGEEFGDGVLTDNVRFYIKERGWTIEERTELIKHFCKE